MAFKLGKENRSPIKRKKLGKGIQGEANKDGSIYINKNIKPGSVEESEVIKHEMKHVTDMRLGKLDYGDNYIKYNGVTYPRKNGKIKYNGKWMEEGSTNLPWEKH